MARKPLASIDISALRHNYQLCRTYAGNRQITAVIKANAYGHGLLTVATALDSEVDAFGLSCYEEALALRAAGIKSKLILLEGFHDEQELASCRDPGIEWVVHHPSQIETLKQSPAGWTVPVWLKIDTGMGRLGFRPDEVPAAVDLLRTLKERVRLIGFVTHLACADEQENSMTADQIACFERAVAPYPELHSIANSAGLLGWPTVQGDWVRPGIMLYGVSPFANDQGSDYGLKPVMTLKTQLISIKQCARGDSISYGSTYLCPDDETVGVVAIGYGDGYPRHVGPEAAVFIGGVRAPIIGRVTMDMLCVSLNSLPTAQIGDDVILWGDGLPVEEVARWSGTIAYELLCQVTERVHQEIQNG